MDKNKMKDKEEVFCRRRKNGRKKERKRKRRRKRERRKEKEVF